MTIRRRARSIALLAVALLGAISDGVARADEASAQAGNAAEAAPAPEAALPTPPAEDRTPIRAEPIAAWHRPGGLSAPLAIAADVFVMRPIGLVSLVAGGAAFVVISPVAAATQTLGDRADTLRDRAQNVITRPIGAF